MSLLCGLKSLGKWSLGLLAGLGLFLGACQGQSAKYIIRKHVFQLPFKADSTPSNNIREMELWVRDSSGKWKVMDRVPPTSNHFTCQVSEDGEYGFSIVTLDRNGKSSPVDPTLLPPELMVLVDTKTQGATLPAKSSRPPSTLKFSGNQSIPEVIENQTENGPKLPAHEPQAAPVAELPLFSPESLHDAVLQHDAGTSVSTVNRPPPATTSQGEAPRSLLVNKTKVNIDYNIKKAGPSGVSKVHVYATADKGKTWQCLGTDTELHSPIAIQLPGEGVFGIRLTGINGNGFGSKPAAGDRSSTIIEVDLTSPAIQDWKVSPGKNGNLDIRWKATDKNLGPTPINLYYRTKANMPWAPMALKVKNDGIYHWPTSQDLAPQYFVRMEAVDRAGNVASCDTSNPVLVDRTEPDIHIMGVTVIQTSARMPETLVPADNDPEN